MVFQVHKKCFFCSQSIQVEEEDFAIVKAMEKDLCVWPVEIAQLGIVMCYWFMEAHK